jgi:tRNA A-37 threonylcarbamoyl transferase component Bud32
MNGDSGMFKPSSAGVDTSAGYSMPELFATTSLAVLYRVRKAGKYFIIKIPKEKTGQTLAMLKREYELSIGRQHPNVVNVFTFEESTVVGPGIVMEYVDGRTLTDFLAENPSQAMRRRVFEQLLQAVAYIHRSGIVHNDIKPENILITRADNDVRLIDFGLADDDAHYLARTLGCTPLYASPELLMQEKDIDARSDIYSLGMIMHDIFANRHLRIAGRCLCAQKEKRYSNAEQLLAAFRHRNRPAILLLSVLALIPLLLLLFSGYFTSLDNSRKITVQQTAVEQKVAMRDSLLVQIEKDVTAIYECVADSVSCAPYFEFANNNIISFYEMMGEYNKEKILAITDPDISPVVTDRYMQLLNKAQAALWDKANQLPYFYKSDLPVDAILHYDSLFSCRKPFVPYSE